MPRRRISRGAERRRRLCGEAGDGGIDGLAGKEEIEEREGETGRREGRGDATRGRSCEGDGRGGRAGHGRRVGEEMPLQARSAEEERGGLRESTRALV